MSTLGEVERPVQDVVYQKDEEEVEEKEEEEEEEDEEKDEITVPIIAPSINPIHDSRTIHLDTVARLAHRMRERHAAIVAQIASTFRSAQPAIQAVRPNPAPVSIAPLELTTPPPQQQQPGQTHTYLAPPVTILPSTIANETRILPAGCSQTAKEVLSRIRELCTLDTAESMGFLFRATMPLRETVLTWGDLREPAPSTRSRLRLYDLLKCGVGIVDLRQAHLALTYVDLKNDFGFNPVDLTVNYALLNLTLLKMFYRVSYEDLIIDFSLGITDYLINLKLQLPDIASMDISIETMLKWSDIVTKVVRERSVLGPLDSQGHGNRTARLLQSLTAEMFIERVKLSGDAPKDWAMFMGMRGEHLVRLGVSAQQLSALWRRDYGNIDEILDAFDCSPEEKAAIMKISPAAIVAVQPSSSSAGDKSVRKSKKRK